LLLTSCNNQEPKQVMIPTSSQFVEDQPESETIIIAEPSEIMVGDCAFLRWDVQTEFFVSLNGEPVENGGEREVCPETTTTYIFSMEDGKSIQEFPVIVTVVGKMIVEDEMVGENVIDDKPNPINIPTTLPTVEPGVPAYQFTTWVSTGGPPGGLGYDIRMDPRNPDVMYVTDAQTGVFKSLDAGETWFPINDGITTRTGYSGTAIPIFSLTIDPNNPDIIWVGTQFSSGVFRSDNGGETWQAMNTGNNGILEKQISIRGLTIEPGNSNVVYFAGEISSWEWYGEPKNGVAMDLTKGVVYKSLDGGKQW
jgi:hypothetical protein